MPQSSVDIFPVVYTTVLRTSRRPTLSTPHSEVQSVYLTKMPTGPLPSQDTLLPHSLTPSGLPTAHQSRTLYLLPCIIVSHSFSIGCRLVYSSSTTCQSDNIDPMPDLLLHLVYCRNSECPRFPCFYLFTLFNCKLMPSNTFTKFSKHQTNN